MSNPPEQPKLRNIIVSIVITPEGETLRTDASISVNGKQVENAQVGLILAGDLSLGVSSGTESLQAMRAVAQGATALAEGLREQVFSALEGGLARLLQPEVDPPTAGDADNGENSLVNTA